MIGITIKKGEDIKDALLRFRRQCQRSGRIREMKRHSFYEKPSLKRRRKERQRQQRLGAIKRMQRKWTTY